MLIRKCTTLQKVSWLCANIHLRDFIVAIHRDICREHSLIGRRNCLMTEGSCEFDFSRRGPGIIDN